MAEIRVPIRWVTGEEPNLKDRVIKVNGVVVSRIPDGEFICDLCNDPVTQRPFPIVGTDAFCLGCATRYELQPGQTEMLDDDA